MGELKSQPFFSPYSWDGGGGGQEAGKGLSWRREVGGEKLEEEQRHQLWESEGTRQEGPPSPVNKA